MKVVMVDDSAAERKLYRLLLEEAHGRQLEFAEAATASAGLHTVRSNPPDCVLLDYRLPDMTGVDFLTQLAGDPGIPPAVVMLTGVTGEQTAVEAMKAGAQDYLVKDRVTAGSLMMAIDKATQKVSLMRALGDERDHLTRSLAEKEVLLQEVHHRVKNNLQIIASLLRLQADTLDIPAAEALRQSQHRVESMALIHEQLYESSDLRQVNLAEHAQLLLSKLLYAYGAGPERISACVNMQPLMLGVDQAIPAGLILNELVSNSLKHAFPDDRKGRIDVEGGLAGDCVVLLVRDDGAGLPESFDPAQSTSLGLRIVQILSRQLKGSLQIQPGGLKKGGSEFRITFPAGIHGAS